MISVPAVRFTQKQDKESEHDENDRLYWIPSAREQAENERGTTGK